LIYYNKIKNYIFNNENLQIKFRLSIYQQGKFKLYLGFIHFRLRFVPYVGQIVYNVCYVCHFSKQRKSPYKTSSSSALKLLN